MQQLISMFDNSCQSEILSPISWLPAELYYSILFDCTRQQPSHIYSLIRYLLTIPALFNYNAIRLSAGTVCTLQYTIYSILNNTLLNSDCLIGCLWSCDIEQKIPFPKSAMEYVPLHSLLVLLYYMFYSIALCVFDKLHPSKCFGERWNVPFNLAIASLNGTFNLSPHENILTLSLVIVHYSMGGFTRGVC